MWTSLNVTEIVPHSVPNVFAETNTANYGNKIGSLPSELLLEEPYQMNNCTKGQADCPLAEYSKAQFDEQWAFISMNFTASEKRPLLDIINPKQFKESIDDNEDVVSNTKAERAAPP